MTATSTSQTNIIMQYISKFKPLCANIRPIIAATFLLVFNVGVFSAFIIYIGNIDELNIFFVDFLNHLWLPALILSGILIGIGLSIPTKYRFIYAAVLFAFAFSTFTQSNFLVWDYGIFGKGSINWDDFTKRFWIDNLIWSAILAVSLVFSKRLIRHIAVIAIFIFLIQTVSVLYISLNNIEKLRSKTIQVPDRPMDEIFYFSKDTNVIHFILDEFQSTIFEKLINEDYDHYAEKFSGFTFFRNTLGSFPTTYMSMPAIMAGKVYKNDVVINDFIAETFSGPTISNVLYDAGYEVDLAASTGFSHQGKFTNWYYIPVPYRTDGKEYVKAQAVNLISLSLFRSVPSYFKRYFHNVKLNIPYMETNSQNVTVYEASRHFAHKHFFDDMIEKCSVKRTGLVYKFIHLNQTHYPAVLNSDCQYAGRILPWKWNNILIQTRCALNQFVRFLEALQTIKAYDNSLIILHADHGYYKIPESLNELSLKNLNQLNPHDYADQETFARKVSSALPLLAVKMPHITGPLQISDAPVQLTDLPTTITRILDVECDAFPGRLIFDVATDEDRKRSFHYYHQMNRTGDDFFSSLEEYIVEGDPLDASSWKFMGLHIPPR